MSYLANGHADTLPVPGDKNGATITFRADATLEDEKRLRKAVRHLQAMEDEDERQHAFRLHRILLMIESWTLKGRDGAALPLTVETLATGLRRHVADWIEKESLLRYEGRVEEEEGPFDSPSQPPSMDIA